MKKMSCKARLALLVAVEAVVLAVAAALAYAPSLAAVNRAESQLNKLALRQSELCRILETSPNFRAETARIKAEIQQIEDRVPGEGRINWLTGRVSTALDSLGIDLCSTTSWSESTPQPDNPALKKLQKSVTVRCSARHLQQFLETLAQMPFVLVVEDMQIERDQKRGAVNATLRLATFVLRENNPAALHAPAPTEGQNSG